MNNWITPEGFKTGIEEVAPKVYAYIQAFGELGVSNAGLLLDKEGAMAVDALMVPSMTRRFLAAIKKVTTKPVTRLVLMDRLDLSHTQVTAAGVNTLKKAIPKARIRR